MNLSVKDRVVLLDFVPKEGNILIVKLIQDLMENLSFSEAEDELLKFHQTLKGNVMWDEVAAKDVFKDVHIPEKIRSQIVSKLHNLDDRNKLTLDMIGIYDKFIDSENK